MVRVLFLVLACLISLPAHADYSKIRIFYTATTGKLRRVVIPDNDAGLIFHRAEKGEVMMDVPRATYEAMRTPEGLPDTAGLEKYIARKTRHFLFFTWHD